MKKTVLFLVIITMGIQLSQAQTIDYNKAVGSTAGNFEVNLTGAATYQIPIYTPPGTMGMQPNVSLVYNSHAGMDFMGTGWGISGLSVITRVQKDHYHEGKREGFKFDGTDHYALDGQRLILVNGTNGTEGAEYRTENETFTRVYAHVSGNPGWPESFTVYTKDGKTIEYGARKKTPWQPNYSFEETMAWYISRITDENGNYLTFEYIDNMGSNVVQEEDRGVTIYKGDFLLSKIKYTGNTNTGLAPYNSIEFVYEPYTYYVPSGFLNRLYKNTLRLKQVQAKAENQLVKRYELEYQNAAELGFYLHKVTEYNAANESYNSTVFTWSTEASRHFDGGGILLECFHRTSMNYPTRESIASLNLIGDINGDGISDIISTKYSDKSDYERRINQIGIANSDGGFTVTTQNGFPMFRDAILIDYDQDGKDELLAIIPYGGGGDEFVTAYEYSPSGFYSSKLLFHTSTDFEVQRANFGYKFYDGYISIQVVDMNGDGLPDIVMVSQNDVSVYLNNGFSFIHTSSKAVNLQNKKHWFRLADVNGDGLTDFIAFGGEVYVWLFNGTTFADQGSWLRGAFTTTQGITTEDHDVQMLDMNGDGMADIVLRASRYIFVSLSTGRGFCTPTLWAHTGVDDSPDNLRKMPTKFVDLNADGLPDMLFFANTGTKVYINVGSALSDRGIQAGYGCDTDYGGWEEKMYPRLFGDFNGDGVIDIVGFGHNGTSITYGTRSYPKKIQTIQDGVKNEISLNYTYQRNSASTAYSYPFTTKIAPSLLVNKVTATSPAAGEYLKEEYAFKNPITHLKGKGFLGFEEITKKDILQNSLLEQKFTLQKSDAYITLIPAFERLTETDNVKTIHNSSFSIISYPSKRFWIKKTEDITTAYRDEKKIQVKYEYDNDGNNTATEATTFQIGSNTPLYIEKTNTSYINAAGWNFKPLSVTTTQTQGSETIARTVNFAYSGCRLLSKTETDNNNAFYKETYEYFASGLPFKKTISATNCVSREYIYAYDAKARFLTQETNPLGHITKYEYEPKYGNLTKHTDPNNLITTHSYNAWGQLTQTLFPDNTVKTYQTDWYRYTKIPKALYYTTVSLIGQASAYTFFDALGREVCTYTYSDIPGRVNVYTDTRYNNKGLVEKKSLPYASISTTDANKQWITYGYDALNRLQAEAGPQLHKTYSYATRKKTVTDVLNNTQNTSEYNILGQLTKATDAGGSVEYIYNAQGLPVKVQSNGAATTMAYDYWGNRISITEPNAGTISSQYNALGELIKQTDAKQNFTTFAYDKLGRMIQKYVNGSSTAEGSATYTYDTRTYAKGKPTAISASNHATAFFYDNLGRLLQQTETIYSTTYNTNYTYNSTGQVQRLTYPSGFYVDHTYAATGELQSIKDPQNKTLWSLAQTNIYGQPTIYNWGNNRTTRLTYNTTGSLTSIKSGNISEPADPPVIVKPKFPLSLNDETTMQTTAGFTLPLIPGYRDRDLGYFFANTVCYGQIQNRNYTYNGQGLLTQSACYATNQTENYSYDNLNRLTSTMGQVTNAQIMYANSTSYNNNGNITNKSNVGNYSYSGVKPHAVTKVQAGINLFPSQCATNYTPFSKIKQINEGSNDIIFNYGSDQQRTRTVDRINGMILKTTTFVNSQYEEEIAGGVMRKLHYIRPTSNLTIIYEQKSPSSGGVGEAYYVHLDRLGSYDVITDENGTIKERLSYDAWGNRRNPTNWAQAEAAGTPHIFARGYTGHEHLDKFRIINMNGRLYDPVIGRFFSPDPYVADATGTQDFNRYSYARNNPLMYTDPDGKWIQYAIGGVLGGINGYMIGKSQGKTGWNLFGYTIAGAGIGVASAGIGSLAGGAMATGMSVSHTSMFGTGFYAAAYGGAISGGISGFGFSIMAQENWANGMLRGAFAGFAGGGLGSLIGGGWGAFTGGFTAGSIGAALNKENIGNVILSGLIGGSLSYGMFEISQVMSYKTYSKGDKPYGDLSRWDYRRLSNAVQRGAALNMEVGGSITDGKLGKIFYGSSTGIDRSVIHGDNDADFYFHSHNKLKGWVREYHGVSDIDNSILYNKKHLVIGWEHTYAFDPHIQGNVFEGIPSYKKYEYFLHDLINDLSVFNTYINRSPLSMFHFGF